MSRNVAIYARVSTEHEAQLSALENQIQYYNNILEQHPDWTLYGKYIDEGITGTSVKKRKNFMKMISDAENGCFDLIITREVSRFARNTVDTLQETRKLKRIGVEVYFTEDNIWTFNDEDGELKLTIMATLAQNESKKTSQRVKAGQMISFQNGVFYGTGNILGYDKVGKDMIINEKQAEIVKFIFSSFLKGNGSTIIKYELEKRGYLTATGLKQWSPSYIVRILQNPFYCGTIVYRKSYIPDYLEQKAKVNHGEVKQVVVEGRHEPIISKEDFNKVQKMIQAKTKVISEQKSKGQGIPKTVWSKKLVCSCGSTFNKKLYHKKADGSLTYCFQCYKQKTFGSVRSRINRGLDIEGACDVPFVQEWKLEIMANVIFNILWKDKEQIINIINNLLDELITEKKENNEFDIELKNIENKISTNNTKIEKLLDMFLNGLISEDIYNKKKYELEDTNKKLNASKKEIIKKIGEPTENVRDRIKILKNNIKKHLGKEETSISEELIDEYVEKIVVCKDKFKWKLSYLDGIMDMNINGKQGKSINTQLYIDDDFLLPKHHYGTGRNQVLGPKEIIDDGFFC